MADRSLSKRMWGLYRQGFKVISRPPAGKCKIINIYWDPKTKKAIFEYDTIPVKGGN